MVRKRPLLRSTALFGAGAFVLHELRYVAGHPESSAEAAAQGHDYLSLVGPLLVLVLALGAGRLVASLAGGGRAAGERGARSFRRVWLGTTVALLTVYTAQESLEGLVAAGHPDGLAGIVGHGGWSALALAPAIGGLVALALCGAATARVSFARRSAPPSAPRPAFVARAAAIDLPRLGVIGRNLARRAPPATSA